MKRSTKHLFLPLLLLVIWLLLNDSLSAGYVVLGVFLAIWLSLAAIPFRPVKASIRRPFLALKLIAQVAWDIILSNIAVGRIVLKGAHAPQPGFLRIPLRMTDPHGLAALACIITYTPGTVWSGFDQDSNTLTLHILDLQDEQVWLDTIQKRYESPLLEIFQ
ncbi:Na+/H+ antiporter subunit E [Alcaligenes sp. SDU_A2]|uniref:Na+/H+ antiporter subunit E n=1 Tax=Alcaligenes sp. SDU_A2 TaxID=3136634 RepID=UPI002C0A7122|nr:Na+/H+ antiporter subunit E [Alcaligenes sp.]HRL25976.1 Na+/H+ antiporter subunit E [Alcaligenes sp.]